MGLDELEEKLDAEKSYKEGHDKADSEKLQLICGEANAALEEVVPRCRYHGGHGQ